MYDTNAYIAADINTTVLQLDSIRGICEHIKKIPPGPTCSANCTAAVIRTKKMSQMAVEFLSGIATSLRMWDAVSEEIHRKLLVLATILQMLKTDLALMFSTLAVVAIPRYDGYGACMVRFFRFRQVLGERLAAFERDLSRPQASTVSTALSSAEADCSSTQSSAVTTPSEGWTEVEGDSHIVMGLDNLELRDQTGNISQQEPEDSFDVL